MELTESTEQEINANQLMLFAADREEQFPVSARDLHLKLQVGTDFTNWIKGRVETYSFLEGEDFTRVLAKSTGGRPGHEYYLTVRMAQELCLLEQNDLGKRVRRELIARYHQAPKSLDEIMLWSAQRIVDVGRAQKALERRQDRVEEIVHRAAEATTDEAIDRRVRASLKKAEVNVFPKGCLKLETISDRYFMGMNQARVSQWLNVVNHPSEEYKYRGQGSEIVTKRVWHEAGLIECTKRLIEESEKLEPKSAGEKKNVQFLHPLIGRFYISKERWMELKK